MLPLRTERVLLRALRAADAAVLLAYRNDPEVARYQDWPLPYPEEDAARLVRAMTVADGPVAGEWVQIAIEHGGAMVGDLGIHLSDDGATATIGYSLRRSAHGHGLATEAVGAAVDWLLDVAGVGRIEATVDPANVASSRLLGRLGFRYAGRTVHSSKVRGRWADDDHYELDAGDRSPSTAPSG